MVLCWWIVHVAAWTVALYDALISGKVKAAALDVFEEEPRKTASC
jgi:phosphoglycerate dehydrogenase-like enzyme